MNNQTAYSTADVTQCLVLNDLASLKQDQGGGLN